MGDYRVRKRDTEEKWDICMWIYVLVNVPVRKQVRYASLRTKEPSDCKGIFESRGFTYFFTVTDK